VKLAAQRVALGLLIFTALFIAALMLGVPLAWNFLFGVAYCLDGYGGCPWE
jgi:hypothetical protein